MKTSLISFLVIAITISAYSQKKSPNIEGAWKLVQYQSVNGNSVINDFPGKKDIDLTKIWSGNQVAFVGRYKFDTTIYDWYGVGTYKLEGNKYEEYTTINYWKPAESTTLKMLIELKNDTLIQTYPVDDKGNLDKNWAAIEKYVRIKK